MWSATRGTGTSVVGAHSGGSPTQPGDQRGSRACVLICPPYFPLLMETTPQFSILKTGSCANTPHTRWAHDPAWPPRVSMIGSGMGTWPSATNESQYWSSLRSIRREALSFSTRMLISLDVSLELQCPTHGKGTWKKKRTLRDGGPLCNPVTWTLGISTKWAEKKFLFWLRQFEWSSHLHQEWWIQTTGTWGLKK